MINFRYHVVSLTAIFLALAIGLIVGTAALNGPVANELHDRVNQLSKSNSAYRDQVNALNAEVSQKEKFATDIAPELLAGKLAGRQVLLVTMQKSTQYAADMKSMLGMTGATVVGQIEIEDKFVDPDNNASLIDLGVQNSQTLAIDNLPANSNGVETVSALLSAVLFGGTPAAQATARTQVFTALAGYVTQTQPVTGPADAVVFLAPSPYTDGNASTENQDVVTIATQLQNAAPIVVGAAGASGSGNVIGAITGDATLSGKISTVDDISTPQGLIAAVLALNEQTAYKKTGHYGLASSATSLLPRWPEQ